MADQAYKVGDGDLEPDEIQLRWRSNFSVGWLDLPNPRTTPVSRTQRYVKLKSVGEVFLSEDSTVKDLRWINLPWTGTVVGTGKERLVLVWMQPPRSTTLTYVNGDGEENDTAVTLPYLAWVGIWGKEDRPLKSALFMSHKPILGLGSAVTPWAYGNVGNRGEICWGSVIWAPTPARFPETQSMFFGSSFNRDLWRGEDDGSELQDQMTEGSSERIDLSEDCEHRSFVLLQSAINTLLERS